MWLLELERIGEANNELAHGFGDKSESRRSECPIRR